VANFTLPNVRLDASRRGRISAIATALGVKGQLTVQGEAAIVWVIKWI